MHNLLFLPSPVDFVHPKAARSSLVVLSLGWIKGLWHRGTNEEHRNNYEDLNILNGNKVRKTMTIQVGNGTQQNKKE
jgi:hypothetical protein